MPRFVDRLTGGFRALRPRDILQTRKSVADARTDIARLTNTVAAISENVAALKTLLEQQQLELGQVRTREAQLRAIAQRNLELADAASSLDRVLTDQSTRDHITAAITGATLRREPFPHLVVDRLLPEPLYNALITGLPPSELFADRPVNKRQLNVPLHVAPDYSRRVWEFMAKDVVRDVITPVLAEVFREPLNAFIRESFPDAGADPASMTNLVSSDGRILLRTRGYDISPHRDPKWAFMVCILYLARRGDSESWGTDIYSVADDREAVGALPHWIDQKQCTKVGTVPFRRNRAFLFVNSTGAHGAAIPADAEPADLERYIYQFRIGPDATSMSALTATLPPDRRVYWERKDRS
jgi:hypothetical protein